jgi:hypothetical protein
MAKSSQRVIEQVQAAPNGGAPLTVELDGQSIAVPTRQQVELRAYELYAQRGCQDGFDVQDWLQAESELLAEAEKNIAQVKVATA